MHSILGYGLFVISWVHTLKSVRYLVLRKGGNDVTFVTYTPFGGNRLRTVPLARVWFNIALKHVQGGYKMLVSGHFEADQRSGDGSTPDQSQRGSDALPPRYAGGIQATNAFRLYRWSEEIDVVLIEQFLFRSSLAEGQMYLIEFD